MRRIAGLPYQVVLTGRSIMRDPYGAPGTPVRVCVMFMTMESEAMIMKFCAAVSGAILGFIILYYASTPVVYISHYSGAIVAVRHGIFTKVCTLAGECELPEGKYKVEYVR